VILVIAFDVNTQIIRQEQATNRSESNTLLPLPQQIFPKLIKVYIVRLAATVLTCYSNIYI